MSTIGLALDDAALAIAAGDAAPRVAPSIVDAGRAQPELAGRPALATVRTHPTAASSRHWFDLARGGPPARESPAVARAELAARLAEWPAPLSGDACVAVPACFDAPALSRLLAVCRAAGLAVNAFVDAAALAAAALGLREATLIVLELGLHHAGATRVEVAADEARRRSSRLRARGGLIALQESWLQLVSEAMVLKTRFDPLHDAATEQRLYDQLPAVAARAARDGSAVIGLSLGVGVGVGVGGVGGVGSGGVDAGGDGGGSGSSGGAGGSSGSGGRAEAAVRHEVVLSRDQFAARGESLYRDLVAMVHELRPAGTPVTLVAPARLEGLPGLREMLAAEFPGCAWLALPDGYLAAAAAVVCAREPAGAEAAAAAAVPLRRGLPRFDPPLRWEGEPLAAGPLGGPQSGTAIERPTHLLWSGRALPLAGATLEIGRAPAAGGIALAEGLAGVSRLHCTLRDEAEAIVLVDHSRHGTWINGERVAGRARLRAGDRLRIGDPGVELTLIAVGGRHAEEAPQH